jgi:hypothetical protein
MHKSRSSNNWLTSSCYPAADGKVFKNSNSNYSFLKYFCISVERLITYLNDNPVIQVGYIRFLQIQHQVIHQFNRL